MNRIANSVILILLTVVVLGAGYYATDVHIAEQSAELDAEIESATSAYDEVELLLQQAAQMQAQAEIAEEKLHARYKMLPSTLTTPSALDYVASLTPQGFETLDMDLTGQSETEWYRTYTYIVRGQGYFRWLHDFVWHLENNHQMARVETLSLRHVDVYRENRRTGLERRLSMVDFTFELTLFYEPGPELSAPGETPRPLPRGKMPLHVPPDNSFYPLLRSDLPPNDEALVDVEQARLLSIVGTKAILEDAGGIRDLAVGDAVYLGRLIRIDPINGTVSARLNKGGRIELVELTVGAFETVPRTPARGPRTLDPIRTDQPAPAPFQQTTPPRSGGSRP